MNGNVLTDEELMLLEQICYIDENLCNASKVKNINFSELESKPESEISLGDILKDFDETAIKELRKDGNSTIGATEASEWADIIEAVQKNDKLKNLKIMDVQTHINKETSKVTPTTICYEDADGNAIVAFRGTTGCEAWKDNVHGLNVSDTPKQLAALEYMNRLNYSNITVVGHSKGGNFAQYVGVLSSKVKRAVSMDGQGMSDLFVKEHWREIMMNSSKVQNYSAESDYVNHLLYDVPGVAQNYVKSIGVNDAAQSHAANSLLSFSNGKPKIEMVGGSPNKLQLIREFTTYIMKAAPPEERKKVAYYIDDIAAVVFAGDEMPNKDLMTEIFSDQESMVLTCSYFIKFVQTYDLSLKDLGDLLSGVKAIDKRTADLIVTIAEGAIKANKAGDGVMAVVSPISYIKKSILEAIVKKRLVWYAQYWLDKNTGGNIDIDTMLAEIDDKVNSIPDLDVASLTSSVDKLNAVLGTVGTIKVCPEIFEVTYTAMQEQIAKLRDEYARLNSTYGALLGSWKGRDQEAFEGAAKNLQDELQYRIQEAEWLSKTVNEAKESLVAKDESIASGFGAVHSVVNKMTYGALLKQAQDVAVEFGGGV